MKKVKSTISINPRVLLAIYVVMPISVLFISVDSLLLGGRIQRTLPVDPRVYTWFILLFMVPHILASFFSFADKEYFNYYKSQLLRGAQIAVILGLFIPALANATILPILIFVCYTMIHVFMQQSGVSKSLMRNSAPNHVYWQWLGIAISTIIYAYLLVPLPMIKNIFNQSNIYTWGMVTALIIYSLFAINIVKQSRTKLGKVYFLGTHFMPIFGFIYIIVGYPILALVIPRIIHDLTAYTFYITHDNNRYIKSRSNLIFKATSWLKIPVYIASPVFSILLAYAIVKLNSATLSVILTCIFFLHYYMESKIWKNNTLHRMQIKFSPYQ